MKRIEQKSDRFCVVETTKTVFTARKVVVSIPTTLYPSIEFSPPLPPAKQQLASSTALGYWSKVVFVFDRPWWHEAQLSGVFISQKGPAETSRDTSVAADGQFSITLFIVGDLGRRWSKFSASERRKQVTEQFYAVFEAAIRDSGSGVQIPHPINVIEKEWNKEPWFWGAPSPFMLPSVLTSDAGKSIRDCFGGVHFVGTELAVKWKGYMEGAVRAGEAGAAEVVQRLKDAKQTKVGSSYL